jgi:hypothetical protein
VQADIRDLALAGQATMFALARWEGPGVLLETTCPPEGGRHSEYDVIPGPCHRSVGGQPRTRLAGSLKMSPPSMMLVFGGGHVTSFWWARWVFAMTVMPAATDFTHWSGS